MLWLIVILILMIPLTAVVLDSHLGRALADYISRQNPNREIDTPDKRLLALESEVERLGREVERLDEETRFLQKLLESKPAGRRELPPETRSS